MTDGSVISTMQRFSMTDGSEITIMQLVKQKNKKCRLELQSARLERLGNPSWLFVSRLQPCKVYFRNLTTKVKCIWRSKLVERRKTNSTLLIYACLFIQKPMTAQRITSTFFGCNSETIYVYNCECCHNIPYAQAIDMNHLRAAVILFQLNPSLFSSCTIWGSYNFLPPFPTTGKKTTGKFPSFPVSHSPFSPLSELQLYRVLYFQHVFLLWKRVPSRNVRSHGLSRGSNVTCKTKI